MILLKSKKKKKETTVKLHAPDHKIEEVLHRIHVSNAPFTILVSLLGNLKQIHYFKVN